MQQDLLDLKMILQPTLGKMVPLQLHGARYVPSSASDGLSVLPVLPLLGVFPLPVVRVLLVLGMFPVFSVFSLCKLRDLCSSKAILCPGNNSSSGFGGSGIVCRVCQSLCHALARLRRFSSSSGSA